MDLVQLLVELADEIPALIALIVLIRIQQQADAARYEKQAAIITLLLDRTLPPPPPKADP